MTYQVDFGWTDQPLTIIEPQFLIERHKFHDDHVERVRSSSVFGHQYIVPRIVRHDHEGVDLPAVRVELPSTHTMTFMDRDPNRAFDLFLVTVLGFTLGLKLLPVGYGHLHRVRHTAHAGVGFVATEDEIKHVLCRALNYWDENGPDAGKHLFAIIHWYLTAQVHVHQYERVAWLYTTLDSIHVAAWADPDYQQRLPKTKAAKSVLHADRPKRLAEHFRSPPPKNIERMVAIRNELIHEASFDGEALGFAATNEANDIEHELAHFMEQLILGLLGVECGFRSVEYDWQRHGLDIIG